MVVKIKRKTPGNRVATHKRREKTSKHNCALCGAVLHGVKRGTNSQIRKSKKSQRRPERPYGGQLCTRCTRKVIVLKAKVRFGLVKPEDIPLSLRSFVEVKK